MLGRIEQRTPDLSRAEQRVARWVLEHPRQAAAATLAEVATACGVSEPTVIRFCRHVGLAGFREFTLRLTEAISRPAVYVHRNVSADDTVPDAVSKVMDASIRTLIDVRARTSSMPFDEAVAAMSVASQLAFAGFGASGHVARDACHKFFRLGTPCTTLTDAPTALQFAAIADEKDVLIFMSHSGQWPELEHAANLASSRGAVIVALTDPRSGLAAAADIVFPFHASEDASAYTPMSSRMAQLALLDALQVALAVTIGGTAIENLRETKNALPDRSVL